jgi:hypothetical protein
MKDIFIIGGSLTLFDSLRGTLIQLIVVSILTI